MKFQKDNSKNMVTKEFIENSRSALIKKKKKENFQKKEAESERQSARKKHRPRVDRRNGYPKVEEQLDLLWHDINDGKIQADTTSANTWYQTIKEVKENNPLPK